MSWSFFHKKRRIRIRPSQLEKSGDIDADLAGLQLEGITCRICLDDTKNEVPIVACRCKGTIGFVHLSCLEHWLEVSNTRSCELCSYNYKTIRRPRYNLLYSIFYWAVIDKDPQYHRGIKSDVFVFVLLTPVIILGIYGCIVAADYYSSESRRNSPVAKWTTISLLVMIILLTFAYYLWVAATLKFHAKVWYVWWQSTNVVHVEPRDPASNSLQLSPSELEPQTPSNGPEMNRQREEPGAEVGLPMSNIIPMP